VIVLRQGRLLDVERFIGQVFWNQGLIFWTTFFVSNKSKKELLLFKS